MIYNYTTTLQRVTVRDNAQVFILFIYLFVYLNNMAERTYYNYIHVMRNTAYRPSTQASSQ